MKPGARPDLTELRRQIDASSPRYGPGRIVKLDRGYAKMLLKALEEIEEAGEDHS